MILDTSTKAKTYENIVDHFYKKSQEPIYLLHSNGEFERIKDVQYNTSVGIEVLSTENNKWLLIVDTDKVFNNLEPEKPKKKVVVKRKKKIKPVFTGIVGEGRAWL